MEQARIEHAPNGSLLTYITIADAMVDKIVFLKVMERQRRTTRSSELLSTCMSPEGAGCGWRVGGGARGPDPLSEK